jgi:hypothetical protein
MKSKVQVSEEAAMREAIDRQNQSTSAMVIGGHIPATSYKTTLEWLTERSKKAAALRMRDASRYETVAISEPIKFAPKTEPPKPAEIGDVVEDRGYVGNKIVQRIKRIVGV